MNATRVAKLTSDLNNFLKMNYPDIKFDINLSDNDGYKFGLKVEGTDDSMAHVVEDQNMIMSRRHGFTRNIVGLKFLFSQKGVRPSEYVVTGFEKKRNSKFTVKTINTKTKKVWNFTPQCIIDACGGNVAINRELNITNLLK